MSEISSHRIAVNGYETVAELRAGLTGYFDFYCHRRPHQAMEMRTPWEVILDERIDLKTRNFFRKIA